MREAIQTLKEDKGLRAGIILFLTSSIIFVSTIGIKTEDIFSGAFFIQYAIAALYLIYLMTNLKGKFFTPFGCVVRNYHIILLLLFNLSAYSLNRTMYVFNESSAWLTCFLCIETLALLLHVLKPTKSQLLKNVLLFIFTASLIFNIYQTLIITPLYGIGVIASLFFGISLHVFVPLSFVICMLILIYNLSDSRLAKFSILSSIVIIIGICLTFSLEWAAIDSLTQKSHRDIHKPTYENEQREMPAWVSIAQQMDLNFVTERYLKSGMIYQECYDGTNFFWDGGSLRFEGQSTHDPLVTIATFFNGKPKLSEDIRLKILDYAYDSRHQSTDRFWSGLNLQTSDVITNVQFFPAYRLAYSELILRIHNDQFRNRSRWFSQEEAIYTFQIPEQSVVSSLSLWIEGEEAKARLTTKSKAENAYNTIVGREMRDPSVVYWMEGNKIRVRVFPCTPDEERQFKIGITSPLKFENGLLHYESITFKGPDFSKSNASINILGEDALSSIESASLDFEEDNGLLSWQGRYKPHWTISLTAEALADKPFLFNGKSYRIEPLEANTKPFKAGSIYIDLNKQWTDTELEEIFNMTKGTNLYACNANGQLVRINTSSDLTKLAKPNFSLFPFHKIKDIGNALVITKGNILTPNLSDLNDSAFKQHLFESFTKTDKRIKVFDLSKQASSYIKSLDEFQILDYYGGTLSELQQTIETSTFSAYSQKNDVVSIPTAQVQIRSESDVKVSSEAPDHLLRLFAYNKVMQGIGRNYFRNDFLEEELINTASTANIVTPISSLIVLETLKDYERFNIDENKDSLENASIKSSGAVPEPHEWAIIITLIFFLTFVWFKKVNLISSKW
ncbi:XrtN system VIT domain-containing protein [Fulvivirga sp. 29W222]|uniref:XrtN system VIT domain-containing protein n=1 Tax=Fulvivirga marina TaxID=2494733 RepID=A0A937KC64_9BACT|nr:XrtN system VIT domain-containing protein [Fulvivirga marina]MBL6447841.1 XrtN system VIT domain-containing protein [Fulvivirga marina]